MRINIKFIYSIILTEYHVGLNPEEIKAVINFINLYIKNTEEVPAIYKICEYLVDG